MVNNYDTSPLFSFFLFLKGCSKALFHVAEVTWKTRKGLTSLSTFIAIMFQPMLILLMCLTLSTIIDPIIPISPIDNTIDIINGNIFSIIVFLIILYLPIQFLVLLITSIIELIFYFLHIEEHFKKYYKLQMYSNNYFLIIISLLAFCPAIFSYNPEKINLFFLI